MRPWRPCSEGRVKALDAEARYRVNRWGNWEGRGEWAVWLNCRRNNNRRHGPRKPNEMQVALVGLREHQRLKWRLGRKGNHRLAVT